MRQIVHYIDWDIVLKCKSGKYTSIDECLKSIWTEEYANPIKDFRYKPMIKIMGQVVKEILTTEQRACLLDKILSSGGIDTEWKLLCELYYCLQLLKIRERDGWGRCNDLYLIDRKGKFYTIAQYDELKSKEVINYD